MYNDDIFYFCLLFPTEAYYEEKNGSENTLVYN